MAQRVTSQLRLELSLALRHGETLLLTFAIPLLILVFFSLVDVLPTRVDDPVNFLFPGAVALSVMASAMTGLAIATGFDRDTGVLKRLALTPLSRLDLLLAKLGSLLVIEALQILVMAMAAVALGWRPGADLLLAGAAIFLGTAGFAGLGYLMAGTMPARTTLAVANLVHLLMLLIGGVMVPLTELPPGVATASKALPVGALSTLLHGYLGAGDPTLNAWLVLAFWAVLAPVVAARLFRWET